MSTWTRLVGDPILSKWIVVVLAISITLNGYLLKGIAGGVVGGRIAESLGVLGVGMKGGVVRFEGDEKAEGDSEVLASPTTTAIRTIVIQTTPPPSSPISDECPASAPAYAPALAPVPALATPALTPVPVPVPAWNTEPIRTLDECIDIFENAHRPLSESLALLNDEEIIMLAQNGKVAAYALEKVLGSAELERAVRIRRALICTFHFFLCALVDFEY
jgi:hydroxymethylglutaryl-CoA reductase (NADPH)